jgi:alanine racemase
MSDKIRSYFGYDIMRHILNSAGAARFPDAQFEMARLGIGLYGIGANEKPSRTKLAKRKHAYAPAFHK